MRSVTFATVVLVVATAVVGCSIQTETTEDRSFVDTAVSPPPCSPEGARLVVEEHLSGAGSTDVVATHIATEPAFEWYSTRERAGSDAYDRASLATYLRDRVAREVTQRLVQFSFTGERDGHGDFGYVITESAGGEADVTYPGKGAIDCSSGKIMVWSEGGAP